MKLLILNYVDKTVVNLVRESFTTMNLIILFSIRINNFEIKSSIFLKCDIFYAKSIIVY